MGIQIVSLNTRTNSFIRFKNKIFCIKGQGSRGNLKKRLAKAIFPSSAVSRGSVCYKDTSPSSLVGRTMS